MKRNPIVIVTLLVLVLLTLPAGSLYVSALAANSAPGAEPLVRGTEEYSPNSGTQAETLYLPLVLYDLPVVPPESTATPTPTTTPTPVSYTHLTLPTILLV